MVEVTRPEARNGLAAAMSLIGIGWYFAICIVGGIVGGVLLDGWLDTKPLFSLVGLALGLALAFYGGFKAMMRVMAESSGKRKGSNEN
jgi:F0F1-type ATP synthase assembly protein I